MAKIDKVDTPDSSVEKKVEKKANFTEIDGAADIEQITNKINGVLTV